MCQSALFFFFLNDSCEFSFWILCRPPCRKTYTTMRYRGNFPGRPILQSFEVIVGRVLGGGGGGGKHATTMLLDPDCTTRAVAHEDKRVYKPLREHKVGYSPVSYSFNIDFMFKLSKMPPAFLQNTYLSFRLAATCSSFTHGLIWMIWRLFLTISSRYNKPLVRGFMQSSYLDRHKRFNAKFDYCCSMFFLIFFCRSVKKGIQVVQILKMKTMSMLCNTFFCLFCFILSVVLLFDDSGSAGQMHS